jgi:uncharacterized membrane protein YeaQ/YmgE (transglycosylase-associated protein family)
MPEFQLSPIAQQWTNVVLIWLGFGILTGLLAKALIPGREPGGAVGVLLVGVLGSVIGPLALSLLFKSRGFNPISPLGLLGAVGGAIVLLVGHRLAAACLVRKEPDDGGE